MDTHQKTKRSIVATLTGISGLLVMAGVLRTLLWHHQLKIIVSDERLTVLAGLSLIYLSSLLKRGKYNAWLISLAVFIFLFVRDLVHLDDRPSGPYSFLYPLILVLPLATFILLVLWRSCFKSKSSLASFTLALRRAAIVLAVAFLYGALGFQLFDRRDFHQEISPAQAMHYTVDQFQLTTDNKPLPYTKRAVVFVDSLGVVSVAALTYVAVSFFAPVRFRLTHSQRDRLDAERIIGTSATTSEDFFKLWPRDKAYFFNTDKTACIAYQVARGVALCVGDPCGPAQAREPLIKSFMDFCYQNGWACAFIHTEDFLLKTYRGLDFGVQKIGEEALVDTQHFVSNVLPDKYFRQIHNRFNRLGYECQLLTPPHTDEVLDRLENISNDWLARPGRAERGFMLGYFSRDYMQMCKVYVAIDEKKTIQGFLNLVGSPLGGEANYDFLRHSQNAPGNINDFLVSGLIKQLHQDNIKTLNMGLCPLAGLDKADISEQSLVGDVLNLVYAKAGRFYSFQGLTRFKQKYEPRWQSRYIIYQGGPAAFAKTMNALLKAMTR